jgi:S-DNA-T family DNA segregation ATPase FtsK/SpoIIIE
MSRLFQKFRQDILGIFFFGAGFFVALSLVSFNPTDPSFNSIGQKLQVANYCGYVGSFLSDGLFQLFGLSAWLFAIGMFRMGVISFQGEKITFKDLKLVWASLLILTLSSLVSVYFPNTKIYQQQIYLGGIIGLGISQVLVKAFNHVGVQVILWSAAAVLVVFYSEKTVQELMAWPMKGLALLKKIQIPGPKDFFAKQSENRKEKKKADKEKKAAEKAEKAGKSEKKESAFLPLNLKQDSKKEKEQEEAEEIRPLVPVQLEMKDEDDEADEALRVPERRKVVMKAKVIRRIENWELPKLSLLEDPPATRFKIDEKEIRKKAETLTDKLGQFSVTGEVVGAKPGPAVTMFEFKPSANVRVSKITELADDLSLALSSESLRIIAPIPGRDVVGIETSNAQRETVYLKDLLADDNFWKEDIKLPMALGKQANGEPKIVDLRKMPHLMVAGTTGSGKSVFVVSAITGLLFKHSPKTLRLIMIDPKQVDLAAFEKIPHLAMPPITETRQAVNALKWAVREMEKRYRSMNKFGARGLEAYNETVANLTKEQIEEHDKANQELEATPGKKADQYYFSQLPYIVIVVEEFGDLMAVDKANVETAVVRLAQMARACGIHLILAMQSPRKEVVTGLIKTNIPGRISFKVNASMDSRIILDETGAERLLAQGDMLYKSPGGSSLLRHHGPFLKDSEINGVAKFWSDQAPPEYDPTAMKAMEASSGGGDGGAEGGGGGGEYGDDSYDDRYDEILAWASNQKEISASLIQRRFQLGYPRAARIVETFEREGVVGPANGSKPRQVLISSFNHLVE